jgi:cysteine desulfurase
VDRTGIVDPDDVRKALTDRTILISLMFANNEIGTLHPMHEIGKIAREKGVLFHCDATQAAGKVPIDVDAMGIDLLSISAHKMYGPKGVGALYVRSRKPRVLLIPLLHGGGHEKGMRSGTLNVPGIIGFARACGLCEDEMASEQERLLRLREKLRKGITNRLDEVFLNGHPERRLAGNLNLSFSYVEAESLLMALPDVALSSASACSSASLEPSHVLRAIGVREDLAQASIRFGLGRFNTEQEVDYVMERVVGEVTRLRKLSPFYEIARARILSGQLPASKKGRESFVEEI